MNEKLNIKTISVDPRCRYNYCSYFLYGLDILNVNWKFQLLKSFKPLMVNHTQYNKGVPLLLELTNGSHRKIYIDFDDPSDILETAYDWSDIYAKVNVKENANRKKILPIGPYCGLKIHGYLYTIYLLLKNIVKLSLHHDCYNPSAKLMVRDYIYTLLRRLPYKIYTSTSIVQKDYCFAVSTLWYDDVSDKAVNNYRYIFYKLCAQFFKNFEGGFFFIDGAEQSWSKYSTYLEKYKGFINHKRIPPKDYVLKTKKSILVFNTPSVSSCLGWKLSEYLMMGKAIISTSTGKVMPAEFIDGKHYILANSESEIKEAINKIKNDDTLRELLENNAKTYFESYLAPEKMMMRILTKAINANGYS